MLIQEKIAEGPEAYDLMKSFRFVVALCQVDRHTVRHHLAARAAGPKPLHRRAVLALRRVDPPSGEPLSVTVTTIPYLQRDALNTHLAHLGESPRRQMVRCIPAGHCRRSQPTGVRDPFQE